MAEHKTNYLIIAAILVSLPQCIFSGYIYSIMRFLIAVMFKSVETTQNPQK